jgi:transposase
MKAQPTLQTSPQRRASAESALNAESVASTSDPQMKLYIGVDIASADFAVATGWQQQFKFMGKQPNTIESCTALIEQMEALKRQLGACIIHLIIEPTGGYEAQLVTSCFAQGWCVTLVNTKAIHDWRGSRNKRAKTDRQDALLLAQYGAEEDPPAQQPLDDTAAELDTLLRRRTDLEQLLRSERNRLEVAKRNPRIKDNVKDSITRVIETLETELKTINDDIKQLRKTNAQLAQQVRLLLSVPGIGRQSVDYLLAALYRFMARTNGQGTAKQFVAYVGLDPAPFESGKTVWHRATISRQGDTVIRSKLYLCARGGIRGHNPLQTFYNSLIARNKPKKVALIACARKTLVWAWAVFTTNTPFRSPKLASNAT